MEDAERGGYAVGYFESWNLESLQGVIDAAEDEKSPVIVGFNGIDLPDPRRLADERLELYASLGRAACEQTTAPAALLFNESPHPAWVERSIELGFNVVMFSDDHLPPDELRDQVRWTVQIASGRAAVEAEMEAVPGLVSGLHDVPTTIDLTDPDKVAKFVVETGIDALALSLGQVHLHGRKTVGLDLDRLRRIRAGVDIPLVLHGATSIDDTALREAIRHGIRKINVGSALRAAFYRALMDRIAVTGPDFNPYEVVGSGRRDDVLMAGRLAVRAVVQEKMRLFGSAGRA
jgi:fructose/tagatose bisphosphate aldolase